MKQIPTIRAASAMLATALCLAALAQAPRGGFGPPQPERQLQALDRDGDGRISKAEAHPGMRSRWSRLDGDKDGYLTLRELGKRGRFTLADGAQNQQAPGRAGGFRGADRRDLLQPFWSLGLTADQRLQLRQIIQQFRQSSMESARPRGGDNQQVMPFDEQRARKDKLKRGTYEKALAILTPEQRVRLLKVSPLQKEPLGEGSGKALPPELWAQIRRTASRAGMTSVGAPNSIDSAAEPASGICRDETFVRRVYADLLGATPTVKEVLTFLGNPRNDKRAGLIDDLMMRPGFAEYQAMHWCDTLRVKSEFPINLWPNGAAVYHRWIVDAMRRNRPYDEFARELLTASGSNFRNPPTNFYRATQANDPTSLAEAAALTFMGSRIETWPAAQQREIRRFFEHVAFKRTSEWKEEIVYWDRRPPEASTVALPDGTRLRLPRDRDPRKVFADWLISDTNRWFARAAVNRVWFWLCGTGVVHEPDDFHPDNPPSNPKLLETLAKEFVASKYDMRKLYRLILTSHTYQQKSPGYPLRTLDAETLQDTFCRIFGTQVSYSSDVPEPFSFYPKHMSSIALPDGTVTSPFLQTFGRPSRDTGKESDRSRSVSEAQHLFLINSTEVNGWIEKSWMLRLLPLDKENRETSLQYIWLNVLSRYPTADELREASQVLGANKTPAQANLQDLVWMLTNTSEFSLRH